MALQPPESTETAVTGGLILIKCRTTVLLDRKLAQERPKCSKGFLASAKALSRNAQSNVVFVAVIGLFGHGQLISELWKSNLPLHNAKEMEKQ